MKSILLSAAVFATFTSIATAQEGWQLVWHDEFNSAAGTKPDPSKWAYDTGQNGWGNNEWENYTDSAENASTDGKGNLAITAIKKGANALGGYTSARIKTQGKYSFTYGKVEARLKLPFGQGIWPAFWALGDNIGSVGWPTCGEIDIMENIGKAANDEQKKAYATVHGPGYSGGNGIGKTYSAQQRFADDFHIFTLEWKPDSLQFFVDGNLYHTVTPASLPPGQKWVFDKPFFLLLNLAVGGNWPGYPDATTSFPQTYLIDYVRVYRSTSGPAMHKDGIVNGASFAPSIAPGSLSSIYGVGLAPETRDFLFDQVAGAFPTSVAGVSVLVNDKPAPLTYISPDQINFQVPWDAINTNPAKVQVIKGGVNSDVQTVNLTATSPSGFSVDRVAILDCTGGQVKPGATCILWGNGFGSLEQVQSDGVPSAGASVTRAACHLTVGGVDAQIDYCGAAPGYVINQLNFVYPSGTAVNGGTTQARLTIGENTGEFAIPAPVN